jgi:hypothetical protein
MIKRKYAYLQQKTSTWSCFGVEKYLRYCSTHERPEEYKPGVIHLHTCAVLENSL